MTDDLKLPSDLEIRMWGIGQEHLMAKSEGHDNLLKLHEQEFILLWLALCGTMVGVLYLTYEVRKLREDYNGNH